MTGLPLPVLRRSVYVSACGLALSVAVRERGGVACGDGGGSTAAQLFSGARSFSWLSGFKTGPSLGRHGVGGEAQGQQSGFGVLTEHG